MYGYLEKEKKIEVPVEDLSFLDKCPGQALQVVNSSNMDKQKEEINR